MKLREHRCSLWKVKMKKEIRDELIRQTVIKFAELMVQKEKEFGRRNPKHNVQKYIYDIANIIEKEELSKGGEGREKWAKNKARLWAEEITESFDEREEELRSLYTESKNNFRQSATEYKALISDEKSQLGFHLS